MTETHAAPPPPEATQAGGTPPSRRPRWWMALLIGSLMLNLLFGGAALARFFIFHGPPGGMFAMSHLQLVPRPFFMDLEHQRREELLGVLHDFRDRFRSGQENSRKLAKTLADALAATPYDEAQVRSAVDGFAKNGSAMLDVASQAAMDFIARLTPEERGHLAQRIRERAAENGPE